MKFKFDPSLQYQKDAISAVVDVLNGQPFAQADATVFQPMQLDGLIQTEFGVGNKLTLHADDILKNLQSVQERNGVEKSEFLQGSEFSVEMETGTGKTYVYIRTIFELCKTYGFKKFIIVVPSIAIREGVLKSIDMMTGHIKTLYNKMPFDRFVYDSRRLGKVRQFAMSSQLQIMVINIQSFQKDIADKNLSEMTDDDLKKVNVINRENDRLSGHRPIEFIQNVSPIVVIDEPQSVDSTEKSHRAIRNLNPLFTLRYSATHRSLYNLIYRLDPVKAYDLRLVKRIEVASIRPDDDFNRAYVKLLETNNEDGIKARVEIYKQSRDSLKTAKLWVRQGDDLYVKSGKHYAYCDGYIVRGIDCTPGMECLEFSQGHLLNLGKEIGSSRDDVMRSQVYETIEQHLKKERTLKKKGIKVLSLFFIDRVANYRIYSEDGIATLGKIGRWFEEAYRELTAKPIYKDVIPFDVADVHNGYFSQDKAGHEKDTRGNSVIDEDTYNVIMRDKERLLDPGVALRFIFSHSALREGWDNPNIFQICTLNETQSKEKKRQEIGRGLRLPVNESGERVHDEATNRLTVVANESYEVFARKLQVEIESDFGICFGKVDKIAFSELVRVASGGAEMNVGQEESAKIWDDLVRGGYLSKEGDILDKFDPANPHFELLVSDSFADLKAGIIDEINRRLFKNRIANARERRTLHFRKEVQLSPEFQELWRRIRYRTRYRVVFDTAKLIEQALSHIRQIGEIRRPRLTTTVVKVDISQAGVLADRQITMRDQDLNPAGFTPDILAFLQKKTGLTKRTLVTILDRSGRLSEFKENPYVFMTTIAHEISCVLQNLMVDGIRYEKIAGAFWEQSRIERDAEEGIVRYLNNLYEVRHLNKTLFDAIEYESEVEKQFAHALDNHEKVKLFVKLPAWFKIDTPIGPYNPDWAFVAKGEQKLYFVCETKGTLDPNERREKENKKIACGRKHFDLLDVGYDVATSLSEVNL